MIQRVQICTATLFILLLNSIFAQDTIALRYSSYIKAATINKHLSVLASDSLEGRETAQPGMVKAAKYVSEQFAANGLPPVINNSYFQRIPLANFSKSVFSLKVGDNMFSSPDDYFISEAPPTASVKAKEIVFAGYGITDSVSGWNDYLNIDVTGKILLILEGEPVDKKGNSLISKSELPSSWKSDRSAKLQLARSKKPGFILFVGADYKSMAERFTKRVASNRLMLDTEENANHTPVAYISRTTADKFISMSGMDLNDHEKAISKKKKFTAQIIPVKTEFSIAMEKTSCTNVLGYLEGSDLKDEVIVISAHLDHLGKRGDKIYYGADDDGSGSASILTMMEVFAKAKREGHGPRRSLLFISFTGEEKGLLGSDYYSDHPIFPMEKTIVDLNIDMIGRVDTLPHVSKNYTYLIGSDKLSSQLHRINENANASCCQLELNYKYNDPSDRERLYYRSDHYNFAKHNVPVIFYFTGIHEDYHKPTDTIDKIDFEKTSGIVKLVFNTAWELANRNERIVVDVVNDFK